MADSPQEPPPPPPWQPSQYQASRVPPPRYPPPRYTPSPAPAERPAPLNVEITPLELASASSTVAGAGMLIGGVGGLTIAAYLAWGLLIPGLFSLFTWLPLAPPNLLYQGILYLGLAVLIWRKSMIALAMATLIFLADSGVYTYRSLPLMAGLSLSLLSYWPWSTIVPIAIRGVVLWQLVASFNAMALVRLDRKQRQAAA